MSTFHCAFLGCKVNQYDAERARRHLTEKGFRETEEGAALVLLASCTVTTTAASKGRQSIRAMLRRHPRAEVAVLGCLTPEDRHFYESLPAPVTILPSATSDDFVDSLEPAIEQAWQRETVESGSPLEYVPSRTRAFLKVEDGCDLSCTYCIIPSVRGPARSRPVAEIREELESLVRSGVREVVLTGVHLGHYGRRANTSLEELIQNICSVSGEWRLRLSSLEASELSPGILNLLESEHRLVPHLHLPLQSGSERILKAMRRPYTAKTFRSAVRAVRERLDDPAITTDVIIGFPGETDDDFAETLALCRGADFSKIHIFPYSSRTGTVAAALPDPVHGTILKQRKRELAELERELRTRSYARRVGHRGQVVIETVEPDGTSVGYDERYHRTRIAGTFGEGAVVEVEVVAAAASCLTGVVGTHRQETVTQALL